jgi:hypothetical protein
LLSDDPQKAATGSADVIAFAFYRDLAIPIQEFRDSGRRFRPPKRSSRRAIRNEGQLADKLRRRNVFFNLEISP